MTTIMNLRSQPRLQADEVVQVTVLGDREIPLEGRVANYSCYGIRLLIPERVAIGAAVKVEWSNTLLLGEVCYCQPCKGEFAIGMSLEHAIYNTLELARLAQRLLDESSQPEWKTEP